MYLYAFIHSGHVTTEYKGVVNVTVVCNMRQTANAQKTPLED